MECGMLNLESTDLLSAVYGYNVLAFISVTLYFPINGHIYVFQELLALIKFSFHFLPKVKMKFDLRQLKGSPLTKVSIQGFFLLYPKSSFWLLGLK